MSSKVENVFSIYVNVTVQLIRLLARPLQVVIYEDARIVFRWPSPI